MSVAEASTSEETQQLLNTLISLNTRIKELTSQKEEITEALSVELDLGRIPEKLTHAGYSIRWSEGRKTYNYPPNIIEKEAALMEAKAVAVATGHATLKPTKPFWTCSKVKEGNA